MSSKLVPKFRRILLLGLLIPTLSFCSSTTWVEGTISAAPDVNPDFAGRPSPLVIRLYELKSPIRFINATFFSLYDSDVSELGDDFQNKEEFELQPGQLIEFERELGPETKYYGVLGAYRDIDNASWRAVAEVPEGETTELTIGFGRLDVTIVEEPGFFD